MVCFICVAEIHKAQFETKVTAAIVRHKWHVASITKLQCGNIIDKLQPFNPLALELDI